MNGMLVPIGLWVMIAVISVASIYSRQRQSESRDRLLQAFVEKGQPIPPELLQLPLRRSSLYGGLFGGIVSLFIGVALAIFLYAQAGDDPDAVAQGLIGLFPISVGLAFIIHALIERKLLKKSDN